MLQPISKALVALVLLPGPLAAQTSPLPELGGQSAGACLQLAARDWTSETPFPPGCHDATRHAGKTIGDVAAMSVTPNAFAEAATQPGIPGRAGGRNPNIWVNSDAALGNGKFQIVTNDGLSVTGPDRWVSQQVTPSPFMSTRRTTDALGQNAVRMTNGFPFIDTQTVGTGMKTFNVGPNLNFAGGLINVSVVEASNLVNSMTGDIVSYDPVGGALVMNIRVVTGAGTYTDWVVGRDGKTLQAQTPITLTAPAAPGAFTLQVADTTNVLIGAGVESRVGYNCIYPHAYVVSKTATTINMSAPVTALTDGGHPTAGCQSGQTIATYGDQGTFVFQDIQAADATGFRFGRPDARDVIFSFDVRAFGVTGNASIMMLGYSSSSTLSRTYVDTFPVTANWTRITLKIPGDKVGYPGTWAAGHHANAWGGLWAAIGIAWSAEGTHTSQLGTPGIWQTSQPGDPASTIFAAAGAKGQTLDLSHAVGAWAEVRNPKIELDKPWRARGGRRREPQNLLLDRARPD